MTVLELLRRQCRLSQRDLAQMTDGTVSQSALSNYERGMRAASGHARILAAALVAAGAADANDATLFNEVSGAVVPPPPSTADLQQAIDEYRAAAKRRS